MASEARAYYPQRRDDPRRQGQPRIDIIPGQNRRLDEGLSTWMVTVFKIIIVAMALLTCLAVVRVWLTNASMDILTRTETVNSAIAETKSAGEDLEVSYFAAANPSRVKTYASDNLGMTPTSGNVTYMAVGSAKLNSEISTLQGDFEKYLNSGKSSLKTTTAEASQETLANSAPHEASIVENSTSAGDVSNAVASS